jgi:dephospho-CoA kinase
MRVIGLTGGIASGKSTVARMLAELGARVIDADGIAREVVEPGQPAFADIVATFGRDILTEGGTIDRARLGALVFADADKRRALNAITHPRIGAVTQERLAKLRVEGVEVAIYEAALLVENGMHSALDGLIVVACSEATQLARLMQRDGFAEAQARARLAAQLPLGDKIKVADWVIDNDGPAAKTRAQVDRVWQEVLGKGGASDGRG